MRSLSAIAMVLLVIFVSSSCRRTNNNDNQILIVGTNPKYPPYESIDAQGNVQGFDIDLGRALANKLGKKIEIRELSFDALILALKQGKIDIILSGMSITSSRQKEIIMLPYQGEEIHSFMLAMKGAVPFTLASTSDLAKLSGSISVQSGTLMEESLSKIPGVTVKALEGTSEVLMDVIYGKSVAAYLETHVATTLMRKHSSLTFVEIPLPQKDWVLPNGIGIKKERTIFAKQIEEALTSLKVQGEIAKLEEKWFKKGAN